jgi:hypothetical protein
MDAITPQINNVTPKSGRFMTESNKIVNVVDEYGNVKVIDVANSSVHAGTAYTYTATSSITATSSVYFMGKTGAVTSHLMGFFVKSDASPLKVEFFESPTTTADGTPQQAVARNRQSAVTATMQVFAGPTVTASGTTLMTDRIFGDKQTVSDEHLDGEWLLKKNTSYLFKITNETNQVVNIVAGFNWIESDNG